jgi:phosphoglycolate phosphatase
LSLNLNPAPRAVLFDLDGTLLDTLEDIARSANEVLHALGMPTHPIDAYRQFIGEGMGTLFERALPHGGKDKLVARCVEDFREVYGRRWNVATRPYPGIVELLNGLSARGLALSVLSNKPDAFTRQCVRTYLAAWTFRVVLGARDGVPRKPDPTGAIEAAQAMDVSPQAVIYLGDSWIDMATALGAGMVPIGASWGFRSASELRESGAWAVIDRPVELLEMIDTGAWASE